MSNENNGAKVAVDQGELVNRTRVCSRLCPWSKLFVVSRFVCLCGKIGSDLWFPSQLETTYFLSVRYDFWSQLSLTLPESFKSWIPIKLQKSANNGPYLEVDSALCCWGFSFPFLIMKREIASLAGENGKYETGKESYRI